MGCRACANLIYFANAIHFFSAGTSPCLIMRIMLPFEPEAEKAHFLLIECLLTLKKYKAALQYIKHFPVAHPSSIYLSALYMNEANYYFTIANKALLARNAYLKSYHETQKQLSLPSTTASQKYTLRGTQLRALYMLGWCQFNLGDYQKTARLFKAVFVRSRYYKKMKLAQVSLGEEALRDLFLIYTKMGMTKTAFAEFAQLKGKRYAYQATKKLASQYSLEGNYAR